jgi:hypothetical protein
MSTSRIGDRIVMSSQGDRWIATIASTIPSWQRQSLEIWFGAWMGLGAMLAYGVYTYPGSERTFYLICMGFWAFFALKAFRAVRWRRSGFEVIQLSTKGLEMRLDVGKKQGAASIHSLDAVEPAAVPEPNPRSFMESMEQQFWVVGGDRIQLQIGGKTHVFGKQLPLREAQQLAKAFNQRLGKLQKLGA